MKHVVFALFCVAIAVALSPAAAYALSWSDVAAYWPFEETTGTHFYDASGNGNDATFGTSRHPQWTAGECPLLDASYATVPGAASGTGTGLQTGYSCVVDNTVKTAVVDLPDTSPVFPVMATNFAISLWADAGVWAGEYGVIGSYNDDNLSTGREWSIGISGNRFIAGGAGGTSLGASVTTLTPGYHHFLAQFTGTNVTALYVDAVSAGSTQSAWGLGLVKGLVLGARDRVETLYPNAGVSYPNTGVRIDEFALIDASLTQANVDAIMSNYVAGNDLGNLANPGGLLAGKLNTYFKLNETTGSTIADSK